MRVMNPVLRRELLERWRGRRAIATLTVYLAVLGAVLYLLYRVASAVLSNQVFGGMDVLDPATTGPVLGRFLVEGLLFFVLLLMLFVAPGYAAAQLSGERERRTLTLLQVTLLRPSQIVLGKLGASTAWLSLLVVAALPLGAAAFFLGGIGVEDLLRGVFMILTMGVSVSAVALGISSLTKRTTGSIVMTYALVLAFTLGTLFLSAVEAIVRTSRNNSFSTPVSMYFNPFLGLADAVQAQPPSAMGMSPVPSPLGLFAEVLPGGPLTSEFEEAQAVEMGAGVAGGMVVAEPVPAEVEPLTDATEAVEGEAVSEEAAIIPDEDVPPVPPVIDPMQPPRPPPGARVDEQVILGQQPFEEEEARRPVWLLTLGFYVLLGALGLLVATRRLRIVEPRGRVMPPPGAGPAGFPPQGPGGPPPPGTAPR